MATPQQIETGAACFRCMSQGDLLAALVYVYNAQGLNMTPQEIATNSACYKCIPQGDLLAALVYLVSNSSGGGLQVLYYASNPNTESLIPSSPNLPAIALTQDGSGQMYAWNITNQNWN